MNARLEKLLSDTVDLATDYAADGLQLLLTAGNIVPPVVAVIEKAVVRHNVTSRLNAREYRKLAIAFARPAVNRFGQTIALTLILPATILATIGDRSPQE